MVVGQVREEDKTAHALRIEGMGKSFGSTRALVDTSLSVRKGSIHALLGGNGSGKSTLIKAIAGVQPADAGTISVGGRQFKARSFSPTEAKEAGLRFVHQQSSTFPDLSIAENLALGHGYDVLATGGIRWGRLRQRSRAVAARFGIDADPDLLVGELGPATQTMVAIARALQDQEGENSGVLVLDEPTASLPPAEVDLLLAALERYAAAGQTIVLVTHRLDEVLRIAHDVTVLRDGHVVARLGADELGHDVLVTAIMGEAIEQEPVKKQTSDLGIVLRAPGIGGDAVELRAGEVVGVAGLLGSGRTRLLRSLFGDGVSPMEVEVDGARRRLASPIDAMRAGIAYIPEDRAADASFGELSIRENITITAPGHYWRGVFVRKREREAARRSMA
jgi:ribose transport system ATP-binding protein